MAELIVVDANREHRQALREFTCTTPDPKSATGRRLSHPRAWEKHVQTYIRRLGVPKPVGQVVQLGIDEDAGLVSVAHFSYTESVNHDAVVSAHAVAIEVSQRGAEGETADWAMEQLLQRASSDFQARKYSSATVLAEVHASNRDCQTFLERNEFSFHSAVGTDLQLWTLAFQW